MSSILIKLSHLFLIIIIGIGALPVIQNKADVQSIPKTSKKNSTTSESRIDQPAAVAEPVPLLIPKIQRPKNFNLSKIAKDLKSFGIHSLKDDHHLEGLPLDRHGKVNPEFHRELFLGNHELFESNIQHDELKRNKKLEEIFRLADIDHDERVTREELVSYLFKNVQDHLREAKDKNAQLFILIDTNNDGKVTWPEYAALYIRFHHMNASDIKDLNDIDFVQESFDSNLRRELLKIRYRWTEADHDVDNELNLDEFLAFRHPEIAGRSYKHIVDDIMSQMDRNEDQKLTIDEFAFLPPSGLEDPNNKEWAEMDKRWLEEQKREFHEFDEDNDGVLTRDELLKAYDPLNRGHIDRQIKKLFSKVDDSPADNALSLDEVQNHADTFADMRLLDAEKVLHEEM
ncbi:unnamed protein product [Adineta ricciae]|uniref:EF-hand domain-containing protein n=1 Tax=Adineta ricciae TaxID=249248 RepID=A0A813MBT9_ADIRI|nr:unnamed protein product [Adineta ricciae]CAF0908481.1 unnamed protein product [Adineta ricciae]